MFFFFFSKADFQVIVVLSFAPYVNFIAAVLADKFSLIVLRCTSKMW